MSFISNLGNFFSNTFSQGIKVWNPITEPTFIQSGVAKPGLFFIGKPTPIAIDNIPVGTDKAIIYFDDETSTWNIVDSSQFENATAFFPAYQDFTEADFGGVYDELTITHNQNIQDENGNPISVSIDPNAILSERTAIRLTNDPETTPKSGTLFETIIRASNNKANVSLSGEVKVADRNNIRIYYTARLPIKGTIPISDFPNNVRVDLLSLDTQGLATDDEVEKKQNKINVEVNSQGQMLALDAEVDDIVIRTDLNNAQFRLKSLPASTFSNWQNISGFNPANLQETNTVFVDGNIGSNSNDGLSIYDKVANLSNALSVAGNGWIIKLLGKTTYNFNSNITQSNLTIDLGEATLSGNFSFSGNGLKIINGVINGTFNDMSAGNVEINNVNLASATINHTNAGNKYYNNIIHLPAAINTENGTGILFFDKSATPFNVNLTGSWTINSNFQASGIESIVLNGNDLDSIIETGFYACNNIINGPSTIVDGTLIVVKRNDLRVHQEFVFVGSASSVPPRKWIRASYGNPLQWGDWVLCLQASTAVLSSNRILQTSSDGLSIVANTSINEVSLFTQSASSTQTNYPIGQYLLAQDFDGMAYQRNQAVTVRYDNSNVWLFRTGNTGTLLNGPWRARGRMTLSNAPILVQKTFI